MSESQSQGQGQDQDKAKTWYRGGPVPLPLPAGGLWLLVACYLFIGLFNHSPWKAEDAIGIGIVHQMLTGGGIHWLLPQLAGEPYLADGPLFYALAALCAKLLSPLLQPHEGARLASALCLAATLWLVRAAGREWFRRDEHGAPAASAEGDGAALVLLGLLGLFVHAHEVLAENAALTGMALAWYGFAHARGTAWLRGGLCFGLGLGLMLWSKGPAPALVPLLAALLAPALGSAWRNRRHLRFLAAGFVIALLASLAWYAALRHQGEGMATQWWQSQWHQTTWTLQRGLRQLQLLSWAAWPAWPLAVWAVYDRRWRLKNDAVLPLMAGTLLAIVLFACNRDINEVHAMPLMLVLALLAGAAVPALRRSTASSFAWFGAMTFTTLGALVWLGWIAMITGTPERLARNFSKLEPGFVARLDVSAVIIALVLSLLWLWLLARSERSPHRSTAFWAGGITLLWGLVMSLWLPWIDYGKTYAPVAGSLAAAVKSARPAPGGCIESIGLGEAQRAVFHYYAGVVTQRREAMSPPGTRRQCRMLLVQADARAQPDSRPQPDALEPGWRRIWEGNRPRDRERFRLYVRD